MPRRELPTTHTRITAENERKLKRRMAAPSGGFDPEEAPIIIGYGSSAGGASSPTNPDPLEGHYTNVVIGNVAEVATGSTSAVAIGRNAFVGGDAAVGVGSGASPGGPDSVAVGVNSFTDTDANSAVAIGDGAVCYEAEAVAIGHDAFASATGAMAIGQNTSSAYDNSVALGVNAFVDRQDQIMLGSGQVVDIPGLGNGIALLAPNGTRYVLSVSNAGALVITATP